VADRLAEKYGVKIVIFGAANERQIAEEVARQMKNPAIILAGRTSLGTLMGLIKECSLLVTNDSGPMHIAAALGKPLVTIFGPTNPIRTGPYDRPDSVVRVDIPCSPCYSRHCSHTSCLRWLTIEPVLEAAAEQLSNGKHTGST